MTLDELKAFVTVAEAGGFTKASALLHRSQPAISRRIDLLEKTLGTPLFERRGRQIGLTRAGKSLLPHAEDALAAVQDGYNAVRESLERTDGALTLAVVGTIADSYLVDVLRRFQSEYENIRVDLQTANSREVSDLVRRGEAAIGLRYFEDADTRLETSSLGSERLYVVIPADHQVTVQRRKNLKPFATDRWLGFPANRNQPESYGSLLDAQLAADGVTDPQITTVDSLTAQKRLVEAGFGIALMPKRNVQEEVRNGSLRLVAVDTLTAQLPVVLVQRRGSVRGASAMALIEMLRANIPDLLDS
ncbi:MAG: LysR family transcriptional regulator [Alphaproteobacteria bacterium]|nr:LysR family transcriptional regulator [Alphaproteobacteria bacterium]